MEEFEILLTSKDCLLIDVTDKAYYDYNFQSYPLVPLQNAASLEVIEKITKNLYSHISEIKLIERLANKNEPEYVAKLTEYAKEKLKSGEWALGIRKNTGETYAVLKDTVTGRTKSYIDLEKRIADNLGNLPELSAMQGQLAAIAEQITNLNRLVERIEQGQYNDRYAGFFSARQLIIEALASNNEELKKTLLSSAIKTNNDTIAKLMLSIHQDAKDFISLKTKAKDAQRIDDLLQNSIGYLNSSVQLNLVAYTALGEEKSLVATLMNYQSFIEQTLLKEIDDTGRTIAWKIDNMHKGSDGNFNHLSNDISQKITQLFQIKGTLR